MAEGERAYEEGYRTSDLWRLPGYILFFLMLFVPYAYQSIKAVLLVMVLYGIVLGVIWRRRVALHPVVVLWTLGSALNSLVFIYIGVFRATPGALNTATVYFLWPLVYLLLIAATAKLQILHTLIRIMVGTTIAIALYAISFILHEAHLLPDLFYLPTDQGQRIAFYMGWIHFNMNSLGTLLFLVPFLFAALLTWSRDQKMPVSRFWLWVAFLAGMVIVLLSGRRALWLVVAMAPLFAMVFRALLPRGVKQSSHKGARRTMIGTGLAMAILYGYLQLIYGFDVSAVANRVAEGFEFGNSDNYDAFARQHQYNAMMQEWSESPLFGAGHGATARTSLRSEEQPWAYELSYVALLFHTGLVGFVVYTCGVVWIYWTGIRTIRSGHPIGLLMLPTLVGTTSFLIANATNPYLEKYDCLWVIFFPVALTNLWLLERKASVPQDLLAESATSLEGGV